MADPTIEEFQLYIAREIERHTRNKNANMFSEQGEGCLKLALELQEKFGAAVLPPVDIVMRHLGPTGQDEFGSKRKAATEILDDLTMEGYMILLASFSEKNALADVIESVLLRYVGYVLTDGAYVGGESRDAGTLAYDIIRELEDKGHRAVHESELS